MKTNFIIPTLLMLCVWTGCQKQTVPEEDKGQDMHPFTEQELKKKQLDTAFSTFFEYLKPETVEDPWQEIIRNSRIYSPYLGVLRYKYIKDGVTLITVDLKTTSFTIDFLGGVHMERSGYTKGDILVYYDNEQLAKLDLIWYEGTPTPVFYFDDGTSYAVTSMLLVDSLIDYLLKNVFSTE